MQNVPAQPRRRPKQGRSKVLVDAIIQACQQILEQEGPEQITTHRIAEVAGVTIGSLYQYFPNKEAIIANLFEETISAETDQISREATARISKLMDISLSKTLRELIHTKAELHRRYLELHGKFYSEFHDFFDFQSLVDERVTQVYQQPSQQQWILKLLHHYRDEIQVDDIKRAAFIIENTIDRLLDAAVEDAPDWLTHEGYLADIEAMLFTYLKITPENI